MLTSEGTLYKGPILKIRRRSRNENLNKVKGLIGKTAQQLCTCVTPF